jgi:hypothetical protein
MEHNGQKFALVKLDRNAFDHAVQTGFTLQGKHRTLKCENCHNQAKIPAAARPEIKIRNLDRSFLGPGRECLSCHRDQHKGQLGADCAHCHSQDAWKPAPGFEHTRARFQLTGLHLKVACQKCHVPPPGEKTGVFKGLTFGACLDCHKDPHRGAFRETRMQNATCESCHNTGGWKNNKPGGTFDHNTTKFALLGKHAAKQCSACHKTTDFHQPVPHEHCQDCHKDTHTGQFAARAAGSDCGSCHNEKGYKPSLFDRAAHAKSAFPLEGKHADVACAKCHLPEGPGAVYKSGKLVCSACHDDKHGGQFASAPYQNRCDQCHTVAGWKPDTFSVDRHARTQFPLTGKHAAVTCRDCHKPLGDSRQFHLAERACSGCHTDPHGTRSTCENCHTTERWKTTKTFDHSTTKFRLDGGHLKVACVQCHPAAPAAAAASKAPNAPVFGHTPAVCSKCHAAKDVHGGQFLKPPEEECSSCHVTDHWDGKSFNHDRARYALDIAHRQIACEKCHKTQLQVGDKMARVYRGTPADCVKCH